MNDALKALWEEAKPLTRGDPVDEYLKARGIRLSKLPKPLRWHEGKSCMVAEVLGENDQPVSLHLTKLDEAHRGGFTDQPPERALCGRPPYGYTVRFGPVSSHLAVTCHIETALLICKRQRRSCWAFLDYPNMVHWKPPEGVTSLLIVADISGDHEAQAAAHGLACAATRAGVYSMVEWPAIPAWPEVGQVYTLADEQRNEFMDEEQAA